MRSKASNNKATLPDARYGSLEVSKLINRVMIGGKKTIAAKAVYGALEIVEAKTKQKALDTLLLALSTIKPKTEVRSRRIGGAAYQVPMPVSPRRQFSLSIRWLVEAAGNRSSSDYHTFAEKLAAEIMDAAQGLGASIKKRDDVHRMAEANKAFSHFRW